ncbi:hypothetical protein NQK81_02210 [Amycolatopsis roodepoortensis]|uniref:hypothetical protein n=1 Tax=Amycolatopsis roodepoortensis TaxID=700274 RepID=UPI00214BCFF2|nr:hypothetical protein [Amycolatopsis roodepoortensis]UUV32288.1 hypothetical protein NQK81_02210 [Amycolatopsis roodepoortensis]
MRARDRAQARPARHPGFSTVAEVAAVPPEVWIRLPQFAIKRGDELSYALDLFRQAGRHHRSICSCGAPGNSVNPSMITKVASS